MPTFCRHNRLIQNCPICSREQAIELRPVVSSSAPRVTQPRPASPRGPRQRSTGSSSGSGVRVRRLARGTDDGYHSQLVPGLRSSTDAEQLAEELAFAATRLVELEQRPPGLYSEVADSGLDLEERAWLAFLIAYLAPLEDREDPFEEINRVRTTWHSGEDPNLDGVQCGPRTAHDAARGSGTLAAYRAWAGRSGSQEQAFSGGSAWTPERRFERVFERLSLPGLHRDARYELLTSLGRLGVFELSGGPLQLSGDNETTVGAKRAFGIGDKLLLERRATALARSCGLPLESFDLALFNWERGERATVGVSVEPDPDLLARVQDALGL